MIWLGTTWLNRRTCVMGNGRLSGRSSGKALGAMFVLLLAASILVVSASRRHAQKATAPLPASPILTSSTSSPHSNPLRSKPDARSLLGKLPLIFEPNQGQADPGVKFLARGFGYSLFLDPTEAVLALQTAPQPQGKSQSK